MPRDAARVQSNDCAMHYPEDEACSVKEQMNRTANETQSVSMSTVACQTISLRNEVIRVSELMQYGHWRVDYQLRSVFGFGRLLIIIAKTAYDVQGVCGDTIPMIPDDSPPIPVAANQDSRYNVFRGKDARDVARVNR